MLPRPLTRRPRRSTSCERGTAGLVRRTAAIAGALALVVTGCSAPVKNQEPVAATAAATAPQGAEPGLEEFYAQPVDWTQCGELQCATATVPVDYDQPDAGSVELALTRAPARDGEPIGSLLINPGGPGGSGVDFLESAVTTFSPEVLDHYDVVGFDPRGIGRSNPVTCLDDAAKDALLSADFDYSADAGITEAKEAYRALGEACAANTGPLLAHVDTESAARDLDVLRAALGDDVLHYIGFSYGTFLGATYAGLFPERAGRLVLDGALDPSLTRSEVGLGQAIGFEGALRAYVEDCQGGSQCPLTGDVEDGLAQVKAVVERARRSPIPTPSGRDLTGALAFSGVAVALYDDASWPALTEALTALIRQDDASILLYLADVYNDRNEDGTFASNTSEAFVAVNCLDSVQDPDPAVMRAEVAELVEAAPTVGEFFGFGGVTCAGWPYPQTGEVGPIAAEGAPPILVIGTTNDPATPYVWAQGLAEQLASGVLLTYEGEGHTAYGRSNECVADTVDRFLLEGVVPEDGTRC